MKRHQWIVLVLLSVLVGCAGEPRVIYYPADAFRAAVKDKLVGIPEMTIPIGSDSAADAVLVIDRKFLLHPPYELTPEIIDSIKPCVSVSGDEWVRYKQLRNCLVGGPEAYKYSATGTLDAETCYRLREGNCFSLTNLFVGASRLSRLSAYYMLVEDIIGNQSEGQTVIHTNHIIAAVPVAHDRILVDFIPNPRKYRFTTILSDIEAAGLFYNNLAARLLLDDREDEAEQLFRVAYALYPDSYQINNNVGVLRLRQGRLASAREHFAKALSLARFPDLVLGNVLTTYERTGNLHAYELVRAELENARRRNPFVYISLAGRAYNRGDYTDALEFLDVARKINRKIPDIYGIQIRIYELLGDEPKRKKAFQNLVKYNSISRKQVLEAIP